MTLILAAGETIIKEGAMAATGSRGDVRILPDHEAMSQAAADRIADALGARPDAILCLATGATPTRAYESLVARRSADPRRLERVRVLKLDEWGGLDDDDPATCEHYLRGLVVDPLELRDRYIGFAARPDDPEAECRRIAEWLARHGPIDLCVLGLGVNGHLGFNEPGTSLLPHAHVARLSEASLGHAMLDRARRRPSYGLTLGMADILRSRQILLLVSGPAKQAPLERLLSGPIATEFPASFLQVHPDVTILCDRAAHPG